MTKKIIQISIRFSYLLLLLFAQSLFAQTNINTLPFEQLTRKKGLPSNMVYQVTEDKSGFIWIATNEGLVRFDGINQRVFQHDALRQNTISGNSIRSLMYDKSGRLWVGTVGKGLNVYDEETDEFTAFLFEKNNPKTISNNDILCIFQDSKNRIWAGTEGGLNLYHPKENNFKRFVADSKNPKSIGANAVLKIFEDSKGRIWVGTWDGGLNLLIPQKNGDFSFLPLKKNLANPKSITSNHIWDILEDETGRIWLATFDGGLVTFEMPSGDLASLTAEDFEFKAYYKSLGQLQNNRLFALGKDNKGNIWVGTSVGLGIFNPKNINPHSEKEPTFIFNTILLSERETKSLPHNEIRNLYFDEDKKIMWVSTFGGVAYHFSAKKKFEIYQSPIENQAVTSMIDLPKAGVQYLGLFADGFVEYNKKTKNIKYFRHASSNLNYDRILTMKAFGDNIWIGSQAGLSVFNKTKQELKIIENIINVENIEDFSVIKIFQDSKKRIWLTTTAGLVQTDLSLSQFNVYRPEEGNPNSISNPLVSDIEEDKKGNLWVVTCGGGLNKLTFNNKNQAVFKRLGIQSRTKNLPATDLTIYAEIDDNNVIWLGTEVGAVKYIIDKDEFINDLPFGRSRVFGFKLINGNIWLTDSDGITRYNIQHDRISKYTIADGLQPGGYLHYAYAYDEDLKKIFFGGAEGYQFFNPNQIVQDDNLSPLLITDLKIFNKSVAVNAVDELTGKAILTKNIINTEAITLSYLHTSLAISVTSLDYENANRYIFAYKLEDLEEEWQYAETPTINYSRLPHGTYTFIVKAQNSDGFWTPEKRLKITIVPPFWKRLDFIILVNLLIFASITWFIYSKIKKVNLEKENLENLVLDTSTALPNEMQKSLSAEDILRENKVFFEKLYFESPLGIAFADNHFKLIKFNEKFASIFVNETVKEKQIFDFIISEKQTYYLSLVKSLTEKQEKTFRQDIPFEINHQLVWLNIAFSFLYDDDSELRYVIIKVSDVTERKNQEKTIQSLIAEVQGKNEELEQKVALRTQDLEYSNKELTVKNEELARFAYIASHDLKEPLRNISSFVGLINRRAKKETISTEILEYLDFIKNNAHQMHTIVHDVLEYSKFDRTEFAIETVDLNQIFKDIQGTLSERIAERNVEILTPNLPNIASNRGFLFLILKNIIENGIKYNEAEKPKIEISFSENTADYVIRIKDNGIGIEPEYHEHIFKMFKRLHTREKYKGSGLGLAICQKIIDKMNGRIEVESELNQGATFIIYHPKYEN